MELLSFPIKGKPHLTVNCLRERPAHKHSGCLNIKRGSVSSPSLTGSDLTSPASSLVPGINISKAPLPSVEGVTNQSTPRVLSHRASLLLSLSLQLHIILLIYFHSSSHHAAWLISLRRKTSSNQAKVWVLNMQWLLGPEKAQVVCKWGRHGFPVLQAFSGGRIQHS